MTGNPAYSHSKVRHFVFGAAILTDLAICALAVVLFIRPVFLPLDPDAQIWLSKLPALASVVGSAIAGLNGWALSEIIIAKCKRHISSHGLTLRKLESLGFVSNGGYPNEFSWLLVFALATLAAKAFVPSALVASLTPALVLQETAGTTAAVGFSSSSFRGGQPDIQCQYGLTYGYGYQCPMNQRYGAIYDAAVAVFTDSIPEVYVRSGVSYPSSLSGLSGAVSLLSKDIYQQIAKSSEVKPTTQDVLRICLPRMNVNTRCSPNMRPGMSLGTVQQKLQIRQPQYITEFTLNSGGSPIDFNTFPDYGAGSIAPFGVRLPQNGGMSAVYIASSGRYVTDLGSANIECNVTAVEEQVALRIVGGQTVELDTDRSCPTMAQPSAAWLPHLTFLAQMVLQKQQGQDGRLEMISLFRPNGSITRIDKLASALTRSVAIGATEMYANLYSQLGNQSSIATYPQQSFTYATPRSRLGNATWQSLLFLIAPVFFIIVVLCGWIAHGFTNEADLHMNPLDTAAIAVAGMNGFNVPPEVAEECVCEAEFGKRMDHLQFRYGINPAKPAILGLTAGHADTPLHGDLYGDNTAHNQMYGKGVPTPVPSPALPFNQNAPPPMAYNGAPQSYMAVQSYTTY